MLKISDGVSKVAMLTIPFFVLAGAIMAEGGMARRLVAFADVLVGFTRVRGGLSVVNVLATTFLIVNALADATSRWATAPRASSRSCRGSSSGCSTTGAT